MTQDRETDIEPIAPSDHLILVWIKAPDWEALTGDGMPLPGPSRLQLVEQPFADAGATTYGLKVGPS